MCVNCGQLLIFGVIWVQFISYFNNYVFYHSLYVVSFLYQAQNNISVFPYVWFLGYDFYVVFIMKNTVIAHSFVECMTLLSLLQSFRPWIISFQTLLVHIVSIDKLAIVPMGFPLYVT